MGKLKGFINIPTKLRDGQAAITIKKKKKRKQRNSVVGQKP